MTVEARRALEAILIVAETPVPSQLLAQLVEIPVARVEEILEEMEQSVGYYKMQTMNQSLVTLHQRRLISTETAMNASSMRDELTEMISRGVGVVAGVLGDRRHGRAHGVRRQVRPDSDGVAEQQVAAELRRLLRVAEDSSPGVVAEAGVHAVEGARGAAFSVGLLDLLHRLVNPGGAARDSLQAGGQVAARRR